VSVKTPAAWVRATTAAARASSREPGMSLGMLLHGASSWLEIGVVPGAGEGLTLVAWCRSSCGVLDAPRALKYLNICLN
jgi:hypothetical protein